MVIEQNNDADLAAESDLLGILIRNNDALNYMTSLSSSHFYHPVNAAIFDASSYLINKGHVADAISIAANLSGKVRDAFEELGGIEYLKRLRENITLSTPNDRVKVIQSSYQRRKLIDIGKEIASDANASTPYDVPQVLSEGESKLYALATELESHREFHTLSLHVKNVLNKFDIARKDRKGISGLPTGLENFDNLLGGLKKSDLIVLAARPSMGKTALAINMAYNIAKQSTDADPCGVAFFSLEMSSEQIANRIMAIHSGYNARTFETGRYHDGDDDMEGKKISSRVADNDFVSIQNTMNELDSLPFYIDDSAAITIASLYSKARRISRKHKISIIFVDYLQLIHGPTNARNSGNRVHEISEVTQGLKAIAKDLNIPVVAVSQLSRAVESRENKRPQLSDLRESGSIEQDADIVAFLYRAAYYADRDKSEKKSPESIKYDNDNKNLTELIISKNRNGPIGLVKLGFDMNKAKFYNIVSGQAENGGKSTVDRIRREWPKV